MTKSKKTDPLPSPCWRVRLFMRGGGVIHLLSHIEPEVEHSCGQIVHIIFDPINSSEHSDTIGFIDWKEVAAVSWRFESNYAITAWGESYGIAKRIWTIG